MICDGSDMNAVGDPEAGRFVIRILLAELREGGCLRGALGGLVLGGLLEEAVVLCLHFRGNRLDRCFYIGSASLQRSKHELCELSIRSAGKVQAVTEVVLRVTEEEVVRVDHGRRELLPEGHHRLNRLLDQTEVKVMGVRRDDEVDLRVLLRLSEAVDQLPVLILKVERREVVSAHIIGPEHEDQDVGVVPDGRAVILGIPVLDRAVVDDVARGMAEVPHLVLRAQELLELRRVGLRVLEEIAARQRIPDAGHLRLRRWHAGLGGRRHSAGGTRLGCRWRARCRRLRTDAHREAESEQGAEKDT